MRRIFTSTFIAAALLVASFNLFAQCGGIQYNFNDGSTSGFTGSGASFGNPGNPVNALRFSSVSTGTLTLTTPTLRLPSGATSIDFGFVFSTGGSTSISSITVAVKYVNTSGQVVTSTSQAVTNSSPVCSSISLPSDFTTTGVPNYQLIFTFSVTGNGSTGSTLTIDDYRTTSTAAQTILPVKFSTFDARTTNTSVSLKWNVATEDNLSGYEVERSFDGRSYSKIGFVGATGESTYSFVDTKPSSITYYRIKSVDVNGRYTYSTVALVKAGKSMIILKAFPSPFIKNLSIQHGTAIAGSLITISSEDGRVVKSIIPAIGTQQTDVDLSAVKAGMYLVRYNNGNGEIETLKILKQQ